MPQKYEPPQVPALLGLVDSHLRCMNYKQQDNRKYYKYHPSEFGKCLRSQQYKHYAQLGYIDVRKEALGSLIIRLFDKGHAMHDRWARYFDEIGILRGLWKCNNKSCYAFNGDNKLIEDLNNKSFKKIISKNKSRIYGVNELQGVFRPKECICGCKDFQYLEVPVISEEMNIKGQADLILDFKDLKNIKFDGIDISFDYKGLSNDRIVIDMKTCNAWSFQKILKEAHKEYIIQLIIYIHLLDLDYGFLIYECKNDSNLMCYKIERDDKLFNTIKWQAKIMIDMAKNGNKLPPPRPSSKSCYECKNCSFSSLCFKSSIWKDSNLENKRKKFYRQLL